MNTTTQAAPANDYGIQSMTVAMLRAHAIIATVSDDGADFKIVSLARAAELVARNESRGWTAASPAPLTVAFRGYAHGDDVYVSIAAGVFKSFSKADYARKVAAVA